MKKIITLPLFVLFLTLISNSSSAFIEISKDSFGGKLWSLFNRKTYCDETPKHLPDENLNTLMARGKLYFEKESYCDAARIFYEVRRQHSIQPSYSEAAILMVRSYMLAGDYGLAINTANYLLEGDLTAKKHAGELRGTAYEEEAHFLIIQSVYKQMKEAGSNRNQEWSEYALGIKGDQEDLYMYNLNFDSFLKKYPHSKLASTILGWQTEARNYFAKYHLNVGDFYFSKNEFAPALARYSIINNWGPNVEPYGESMYKTVYALNELSKEILDPSQMNDKKLEEVAKLKNKEEINRSELSKKTKLQALHFLSLLQTALPNSLWTQKAKALLEQK